jgi:hypothetical protein
MILDRASERTPVPWRNGLGVQYEICCDGSLPDDWTWRLSTADITQDVKFSSFPLVQRHFCVAEGNGVVLNINGIDHVCRPGSVTQFRGDDTVFATLIDGPMKALNLMARDSAPARNLVIVSANPELMVHQCDALVAIGTPGTAHYEGSTLQLQVLDAMLSVGDLALQGVFAQLT